MRRGFLERNLPVIMKKRYSTTQATLIVQCLESNTTNFIPLLFGGRASRIHGAPTATAAECRSCFATDRSFSTRYADVTSIQLTLATYLLHSSLSVRQNKAIDYTMFSPLASGAFKVGQQRATRTTHRVQIVALSNCWFLKYDRNRTEGIG